MNKSCIAIIPKTVQNTKFFKALAKYCGNDENRILDYFLQVANTKGFEPNFVKWYKRLTNSQEQMTFDSIDENTIMDYVYSYINNNAMDGRTTIMDSASKSLHGYTTAGARKECVRDIAKHLENSYAYHMYVAFDVKEFTKDKWFDLMTDHLFDKLLSRTCQKTGLTEDEIQSRLDGDRYNDRYETYVEDYSVDEERAEKFALYFEAMRVCKELLGTNIASEDINLIAALDESLDYTLNEDGINRREAFFEEVLDNVQIAKVKDNVQLVGQEDEDTNKDALSEDIADGEEKDGLDVPVFERDRSVENFDNHDGQLPTFLMHLSDSLVAYFNSLPVLNSTRMSNGEYDYDSSTAMGMSKTMNATECATILFQRAKTNGNIEQFIESIREIAETMPGMEGFIKLYWDLKGYDKTIISSTGGEETTHVDAMVAFAEELYRTFSKPIFAKREIYIDRKTGELKSRISNYAASRRDSFRLQCFNEVKSSAISVVQEQSIDNYNNIINLYNTISANLTNGVIFVEGTDIEYNKESSVYLADKRHLLDELHKVYKWYYGDVISLASIYNFVDSYQTENTNTKAREVNDITNINTLIRLLSNTIRGAQETKDLYDKKLERAAEARSKNRTLKELQATDSSISIEKSLVDVSEIYAENHVSKLTESIAYQLADLLVPYSIVKTQLNSRNAAGNNSSDVLNNNMLGYLKTILEHEDNVEGNENSPINNFAKYKFRNKQYDGSTLLIEHRNDNGDIDNLGLFRRRVNALNGHVNYVPTEYATELLRISLFNGTADHIKSKSALYANMSKGDYLISALTSFHNSIREGNIQGITFADYFLRTPSDAPKNFMLSLPRYSVEGLFVIANEDEINADADSRINNLTIVEDNKGIKKSKGLNPSDIADIILGENSSRIYLNKGTYVEPTEEDEYSYALLSTKDADTNEVTTILVKGDLGSGGKDNKYLDNVQFVGIVKSDTNISNSVKNILHGYYTNAVKNNKLTILNGNGVTRTINRNHRIYRSFYNTVLQEISDAYYAADTLFEKVSRNDDGAEVFISGETLEPIWKGKYATVKDPHNLAEQNYHSKEDENKNPKVFIKDKNGVIHLQGNVWKSDRFTKFSDVYEGRHNVEANYFEDLFADGPALTEDGRIHLLYGGNNTHVHVDSKGDIVLTEAQKTYVESRLDAFIVDYCNDTQTQINEFEELIDGNEIPNSYNDVAEFILNYRLAYYACADLLEGDSKSYKSFTDFLKRAKEVQGAGVAYSAIDYTRIIHSNRDKLRYSSLNLNPDILKFNEQGLLHDCTAYSSFRGITVKNTVRTSKDSQGEVVNKLADAIYNSYTQSGIKITKDKAKEKASEIMGNYAKTKTNDAQSYITFEEWIRRISMRGQLPKYLPLIKKILNENEPITVADIDEFVQVQKNFYYDMYYDETTNHMRARQIKNAEFVLIPRFIKGTQLETVYNEMIKYGIDQLNTVETSKAGKANVQTLWDNEGNLSDEWFKAPETQIRGAIELYDYNFLYTQQETPQHMNSENKAAIQLMKKIVDNIPQYLNGKEHPLWKAKKAFQRLYAQNIKEANRDLYDKLNISYDKNGNFNITDENGVLNMDTKVFCRLLKQELIRQGTDSQLLDYVTLNTSPVENNGYGLDTKMPILANNAIRTKFEFISQALFNNNITRQTLPGFHAAQITGVGWRTDNEIKYHLTRPDKEGTLKKTIDYKTWKSLSKENRVRYTPENGIGTAENLQYHPAQYKHKITGRIITEKDWLKLTDKKAKNYTLNSAATYIEVRVPKSVFNLKYKDSKGRVKTDEQLLQELEDAGLDKFLGYRIPTEGKQSMAIMKIVGFVDDTYGSTIVVPDDWVGQTGSDFDIDSVYTVVYNNYVNEHTGRVEKIKYKSEFGKTDYIRYIGRRLENYINDKEELKKSKEKLIDDINQERNDKFNQLNETESEIYETLSDATKNIIKKAQNISKRGLTRQQAFLQQKENVINDLKSHLAAKEQSSEEYDKIIDFINITQQLHDAASSDTYRDRINEGIEELNDEHFANIEKQAIALNLPSYEEYTALDVIEKNSKKARSNELLRNMLDILASDWSLEENLSQSNFREVVGARDNLYKLIAKIEGTSKSREQAEKESRSPYDFMAQVNNQDEAISGRALKGIAVQYNNVVSIANSVRPYIGSEYAVTVEYPIDKYDNAVLARRFNEYEKDENGREILDEKGNPIIKTVNVTIDKNRKVIIVKHNTFGWTNDNRTVNDFILTTYSSQTVAHQLDIIKEGGIPNVNNYTFSIYNLFPAIGSNYETIVAFMAQPAVTEIVNQYNRSKSIYSSRYIDPIRAATIAIAKQFDSSIKYYGDAINLLNEKEKEFGLGKLNVLNADVLTERKTKTEPEDKDLIFDYLVIKKFTELRNTAEKINAYSFIINPDKYGAKQTIFATNKVLNKIANIESDNQIFVGCKNAYGVDTTFLDAIFPGISEAAINGNLDSYIKNSDDNASIYPPLHYFMKYATIPSIIINRRLFQTQHPKFRNIVEGLTSVMSGKRPILSEKTNNSFASYIVSYLYNQIDMITKPIEYDLSTHVVSANGDGNARRERIRIYGFDYGENFRVWQASQNKYVEFNPIDKTNPTEKELKQFMSFSPAQKIAYIQRNSSNPLVFEYVKVNLSTHNSYNVNNPNGQVIEFMEDAINNEDVYELFNQTFMNTNPFFRLAALDLIKYAYVVESRVLRRNSISKMIPNDVLIMSREQGGTGIIDDLKGLFEKHIINQDNTIVENLLENYVRSHPNMTEISQARFSVENVNTYFSGRNKIGDILQVFDNDNTHDFLINKGILREEVDNTGETITLPNKYIHVSTTKNKKLVETLYKIVEGKYDNQYFLIPLNKLESNEFDTFSSNPDNNVYLQSIFYEKTIEDWKLNGNGTFYDYYNTDVSQQEKDNAAAKQIKVKQSEYKDVKFNFYGTTNAHSQLRDEMADWFSGLNDKELYSINGALTEYAKSSKMKVGFKHRIRAEYDGRQYFIYRAPSTMFTNYDKETNPTTNKSFLDKYNKGYKEGVFVIMPVQTIETDNVRFSTVAEVPLVESATRVQKTIGRIAETGDNIAVETAKINASEGITYDTNSVQRHLEGSLLNTRNWVKAEVEAIINGSPDRPGLNLFVLDPDTASYLKMTDPKVFAMMLNNPVVHRSYLKTYLDAVRLIEMFEVFDYTSYAEDQEVLKVYVEDIKKELKRLEENPIFKEAEKLYVTEHLAKVSNNPNIQRNIISLLDGYHKTSFLTSYINDLQDTSNPIIQIITKTVMADIRAKELQMEDTIRQFDKRTAEIIDKAKAAGYNVDFDKFINKEDGTFIEGYNTKFVQDYDGHKARIKQTYFDYNTSTGSDYEKHKLFEKYLKAKYEFDKFLLKHINREISDEYYYALLKNTESMLKSNGEFLEIYVEYERLLDRKRAISKLSDSDGHLTDELQRELDSIEERLKNISSPVYMDEYGVIIDKEDAILDNNEELNRIRLINSHTQATLLNEYISNKAIINEDYITFNEKEGFRDLLERYLDIIARYEQVDPITGSPKYSQVDLAVNDEYNKAKDWIRINANFKYGLTKNELNALSSDDVKTWLEKYYNGEISETDDNFKYVLGAAIKYFKNKRGTKANKASKYKEIAKLRDARDVDNVIDARKFTDEDLKTIRQEELDRLGTSEDNPYSERAIIHTSSDDIDIFTEAFYKGMMPYKNDKVITTKAYKEIVKNINDILRKAYIVETKTLDTSRLSDEDLNNLLKEFNKLGYDETTQEFDSKSGIRKRLGISKSSSVKIAKFIKQNVVFTLSEQDKLEFEAQEEKAKLKGEAYFELWQKVNYEVNPDNDELVPNHLLWGHAEPKPNVYSKFLDKQKTAAVKVMKVSYKNHTSVYYDLKLKETIDKYGRESQEFKDWYELNHVYNPNTHTIEPLSCWTVHSVNSNIKGNWTPNYGMRTKQVKDGKTNPNYKKGLGHKQNYKDKQSRSNTPQSTNVEYNNYTTPDSTYDNETVLNEYESEMKTYITQILSLLAKTPQAKEYLAKAMPAMANTDKIDKPSWLIELAKTFGVVDSNRGVYWDGDNNIGYETDYIPQMPMTAQLTTKETVHPPVKEKYGDNTEAYQKALEEYEAHKSEIEKKNSEIHNSILNRDWLNVMREFMRQAAHYNAIQDNKYQLYFAQDLLRDIKVYDTRPDTHRKLKKNGALSTDGQIVYKQSRDENLIRQYNNWLYRVIFNYYKQAQGAGERIGSVLQGFTSSSYMTLNVRAGIANVLVGDSNIAGEAFAAEYFGFRHWAISKKLWGQSIMDYLVNMYSDKADTKVGAIIKGMMIVDYSELNGRITQLDLKRWSQAVTDLGFSPNNIGEHLMQNGAMIAMMLSHKVIENPNYGQPGEKQYIVVNFSEYTENVREQILLEMLTPEQQQQYRTFIANIKKDANGAKDFAWYRKDPITKFIVDNLSRQQAKEFKKKVEAKNNEMKDAFKKAPTVFDQLDRGDDGKMTFAKDSIFERINVLRDNQEITDAYLLLGEFKGRCISVNKKIHGNYGKLDAAYIEKYWMGRLAMQYHKHLPTGILKHYRREGYFNEERGSVEKGMYTTLYDFLSFPIEQLKSRGEVDENEAKAIKGLQNIFSYITDYFKYLSIYADVMPEYEKANMRRMLGNITGMLLALGITVAAKAAWDDDDDDNRAYNLLIYEMDRLASETFMWTPYGMVAEFRKQWSSPVAAGSIITDSFKIMSTIAGVIFQGSDYDPFYHTGRFAGRHKLAVYFERRIPYYRNYATIRDIADNNKYYKVGDNILSFLSI